MILYWEQNDPARFEANLGPRAKAALTALLEGKSWEAMRREMWPGGRDGQASAGYKFDIPGRWSEPEETLVEKAANSTAAIRSQSFMLKTVFKDRFGTDCATHAISFVEVDTPDRRDKYLVDSSDLGDLLQSISSCAAR